MWHRWPREAAMSYLTQRDIDNFGPELIDVATRAAQHAMAPELQRLHEENQGMQERLAEQAHKNLQQELARRIPGWEQINQSPALHQWLAGVYPPTGTTRQHLLDRAVAESNASRVAQFFREFLQQAGQAPAVSASQRTPRRTRMTPSGQRVYSRPEIEQMWARRRKGLIGDEAWARWEHELCRASAEGRIAGGLDQDGIPVSR